MTDFWSGFEVQDAAGLLRLAGPAVQFRHRDLQTELDAAPRKPGK